MRLLYKVIRFLVVTAIVFLFVVPAVMYVALSLSGVQRRIADRAEIELSKLLDAKVTIGSLGISPFNRAVLRNISVETAPGDTALTVTRLGAGVDLLDLLMDDMWTVSYVELVGLDARLRRDSVGAPLNIQPVIDALKPKEKKKQPSLFDFRVHTVILRSSSFSYDIVSAPEKVAFDPNHVGISNLRADIRLPRMTNDDFTVDVKRLAFDERSGFSLQQFGGLFHVAATGLSADGFTVELPGSCLEFADMSLPLHGFDSLQEAIKTENINIELLQGAHLFLPDIAAFVPQLYDVRSMLRFRRLSAVGNATSCSVGLEADLDGRADLSVVLTGKHLLDDGLSYDLRRFKFKGDGHEIASIVGEFTALKPKVLAILSSLGYTELSAEASGTRDHIEAEAGLIVDHGVLNMSVLASRSPSGNISAEAGVQTDGLFALGGLLGNYDFGAVEGGAIMSFVRNGRHSEGSVTVEFPTVGFKGYNYSGVSADAEFSDKSVKGNVSVNDDFALLAIEGSYDGNMQGNQTVMLNGAVKRLCPDRLNLWNKYSGAVMSGDIDLYLEIPDLNDLSGFVELSDISLKPVDDAGVRLESMRIDAERCDDGTNSFVLVSDFIDGKVAGRFDWQHLPEAVTDIVSHIFPSLVSGDLIHRQFEERRLVAEKKGVGYAVNDFTFDFTVKETERIAGFFKFPVSVIYPVKIAGAVNQPGHDLVLNVDAPYLRQGNKLIENSSLSATVSGAYGDASLDLSTMVPTKNGPMTIRLGCEGGNDLLNAGFSWQIDRERAYEGSVSTTTFLSRSDDENLLLANVDIHRSHLTFNDSTWTVDPAVVSIAGKEIEVNGIDVHRAGQFVRINGEVSQDPMKLLTLDLKNFSLDYLFESLGIDKVMLGGSASGTFYASGLYSGEPVLETPGLSVSDISYNKVVLGDASVRSNWDTDKRAISLNADIDRDGHRSKVDGAIFPLRDSLDLTFTVDRTPVGFMEPYMSAFASDISGYGSGRTRIFGNFKYIDLEGEVFAEDLRLKINFTNTYYTATDSVCFSPGFINLNGITIKDAQGNAARLNGYVKHKFFKEPSFEFSVTDARNFLCYNETPKENPRWYGRLFGNGAAFVSGKPGVVNISVDMATAPNSNFTFVLSDQEVADEYSFLTFRDKMRLAASADTLTSGRDTSMDLVNRLRSLMGNAEEEGSSDYNITLQMTVTPDAQINLVMDPVGGDRIRSYGSGHLRMDYGSANNELKMYGTYKLDRGDYNFTLQDIIIKDFTIKPGSKIDFQGDPYAAQLDIQAVYSLNANLSDLDESFLQDKDLNRTNVPVHALMKVSGDIRQPEIAFDLEFPTLTSDVYRKVRSIISTDDMMNRQIIYLLALNRFYTPDYMASTTKGNELVSVASSTISSQLSNILGQISDNWNIAPTFRSDRGDFSDVEVDVALSSRLLNNRLLFNGNFGYRDKSLNANQFVGDFDLEYLLNRSGNFRLKAYNRYNDQNYYLRSALTTQGVGVILRKDFDSLTSFLRPLLRRKKKTVQVEPLPSTADSIVADSVSAKSVYPVQREK